MASYVVNAPALPIPISQVAHRFYLYDISHITFIRHAHHIPGTLIGSLPQAPQQNVFLGLPIELMAEEARLLVEKGVAYIVDDVAAHRDGLRKLSCQDVSGKQERRMWKAVLEKQGQDAAWHAARLAEGRTEAAVGRLEGERKEKALKRLGMSADAEPIMSPTSSTHRSLLDERDDEETLFSPTTPSPKHEASPVMSQASRSRPSPALSRPPTKSSLLVPHHLTPTTSHPFITTPPPPTTSSSLPPVPKSYALYRYLNSLSYFQLPGLRFGCQYMVYPGDPLRFHSQFLAVGLEWEEQIELLTLVGGGRLGTGVKKGFLLGGTVGKQERQLRPMEDLTVLSDEVQAESGEPETAEGTEDVVAGVRCFSIEWAGM